MAADDDVGGYGDELGVDCEIAEEFKSRESTDKQDVVPTHSLFCLSWKELITISACKACELLMDSRDSW